MSGLLRWTVEQKATGILVRVSGRIDEDADLQGLLSEVRAAKGITIDLSGLERINSCGVREWMNFVRALPVNLERFRWERCSPVVVAQLNIVANFAGRAEIQSVMAPFACNECSHEDRKEIQVRRGTIPSVGSHKCTKCGSAMEFDDMEESYFSFVRTMR